jgi:Ca2+-binding RTX toxin-like protein
MEPIPTNGDDRIEGTNGRDNISALGGDDKVFAFGGKDRLFGDNGDDLLNGGAGSDRLFGGDGNDKLRGEEGNDELEGGKGDDSLAGGTGDDILSGGRGVDLFNFNVTLNNVAGRDTIVDFDERREFINLGPEGSFGELDTNGDGELTDADDFVTTSGRTTVIDVGQSFGFGPGTDVLTVVNSINSPLDGNDSLFN